LATLLGAVFGAALFYGLMLCWVFMVSDLGESALVVMIIAVALGTLGGGWAGYALARQPRP
jgi:hypothetical protein